MNVVLSPSCYLIRIEGDIIIANEHSFLKKRKDSNQWMDSFLEELKSGIEIESIHLQDYASDKISIIIELEQLGFIIEQPVTNWENEIFQKQFGWICNHSSHPEISQSEICQSRVAIIGVGGLGSLVAQHLLAAGVSDFILIDSDVVVLDNLNRQYLFSQQDIGRSKVDAVADYLVSVNPNCKIVKHKKFIESVECLSILSDDLPNFIVQCADTPKDQIDQFVSSFSSNNQIPFITAGVGLDRGYYGPLIIPGKTACHSCLIEQVANRVKQELDGFENSIDTVLPYSFGPTNSIIASLCAREVILCLMGENESLKSLGSRVFADLRKLSFHIEACAPCSC